MRDSYEGNMMKMLAMPTKQEVAEKLLYVLYEHNGTIKKFTKKEPLVNELADIFHLSKEQRETVLERNYYKDDSIRKSSIWIRLLFRAANDVLAKQNLVTNPKDTKILTNKEEWMLTEKGYDKILKLQNIPLSDKEFLPIKSYEVQKEIKRITETPIPENYDPFETRHKTVITKETSIRSRGFRQAIINAYDCKCSVCGLKLPAPKTLNWEVEAAHIIPHGIGKDDIWNGIALCHFHHWAFDVGWFSFTDDYKIIISSQSNKIHDTWGKMNNSDFFRNGLIENKTIILPENSALYPHKKSIEWHRNKIFIS